MEIPSQPATTAPPTQSALPSHFSLPFADPRAARVWNYWFARRHLGDGLEPAADPFAEAYAPDHALWFRAGADVDAEIALHFGALVDAAARGECDAWENSPRGALALAVVLDQFPRHVHRGTARAFACDARARAVVERALARGFDRELSPPEALFFFLALTHAEDLAAARAGLAGIASLGTRCAVSQRRAAAAWKDGAVKHVHLLERFGRYPHRNAALAREDTPEERAFLERPDFKAVFMRSQSPREERAAGAAPRGAPGGPRLRILALHGFRQNGEVFRKRVRKMRLALEDVADFTFVTSPMEYAPTGDAREGLIAALGEVPEYPMQRVWWSSTEDNREYAGFDASIAFLESFVREHGPFDGVVGFAQGGTLAALLAAMQPHPVLSFQFAICISAFPSRAEAHAPYVRPGAVGLPAIHVVGLNDLLVTPDRSLALFESFDPAHRVLAEHPGGHFVPSAWPYDAIRTFVTRFAPSGPARETAPETPPETPPDAAHARYRLALESLSAHARGEALEPAGLLADLAALASAGRWRELQSVAVHAASLREGEHPAAGDDGPLALAHRAVVRLFAEQLAKDLDAVASMPHDARDARTRRLVDLLTSRSISEESRARGDGEHWPSPCAKHAPTIRSQTDKRCRLARDVARELFPHEHMLAFIARAAREGGPPAVRAHVPPRPDRRRVRQCLDEQTQARNLSYQRYTQTLSLLRGALSALDPAHAARQLRAVRAPHLVESPPLGAPGDEPVSRQVAEPEPEPVVPCSLDQLAPLLAHLEANAPVDAQLAFDKGTLTVDGRLDLCKQVVGPEGIRPLLQAMMHSDGPRRLLLGNNIVGDGGAAAIAEFIRAREHSPLECWYIAGNRITAAGIAPVCDALAGDARVTALWLKRNPLKAAGMAPLARLLRANCTLEVLDLVNCGLMDDGLAVLLSALRGPGANKTLRHLYVGTNGITAASAPLVADYLANDCALESLYLSCNRLGDDGAEALARGLAANRGLRRVSLASNRVGPRGAWAIARALEGHPTVQLLDLGFTKATVAVGERGNFLGDEGARACAHMLERNTVLRSLDLLHNGISQVGVNAVRAALAANGALVSLQFTQFGRVHNEPGKEEIRAALRRNRALVPPGEEQEVADLELPAHVREIYSVYRTHL